MSDPLKRKYRLLKKLIKKYHSLPEDQQKYRDIIKTKLADLKQEIQELKRTHDTCADRQGIIAQINALRASGRLTLTQPVEDHKYSTEELEKHLDWCNKKLRRGKYAKLDH